jgi:hypothetical protein
MTNGMDYAGCECARSRAGFTAITNSPGFTEGPKSGCITGGLNLSFAKSRWSSLAWTCAGGIARPEIQALGSLIHHVSIGDDGSPALPDHSGTGAAAED